MSLIPSTTFSNGYFGGLAPLKIIVLTIWELSMVNNAGVALESGNPQNIWDFPQDIWEKDLAINSTGVFLGCKYAAAQMIKQEPLACGDRGWILNTASVFGLVGSSMIGKSLFD